MHACELLPVAAIVADSAAAIIRMPLGNTSRIHHYWSASRERLDLWVRGFASYDTGDQVAKAPDVAAVMEEILYSEVLTRVWTGATLSYDAYHESQTLSPVARSIFLGHQESRNRALLTILKMHESQPAEGRRLNVLRQKCERWTDMFLAYFPYTTELERIAFDPQRCKDFADDIEQESRERDAVQSLTMASLEATAKRASNTVAVNPELNTKIASAVLGCLPADAFDATGMFSLMWQNRIENTTDNTMGLVEQLLSLECTNES